MNDTTKGIGRLAKTYFSSKDQLVTLGFAGGPGPAFAGAQYTGWQLGRSFGALITTITSATRAGHRCGRGFPERHRLVRRHIRALHAMARHSLAQIGAGPSGYPTNGQSKAWDICRDRGVTASIAILIEMQMRHGMPPLQEALNHGILPSLSPDVDTNMTTYLFSLMRGAYCLQRALANDLAFPESNPGGLPVPHWSRLVR